jgi:hypothetical protein
MKNGYQETAMRYIFLYILSLLFLSGCAVNPVTGDRELAFISESQEIVIGAKNYIPSRQMQGGRFPCARGFRPSRSA